MRSMRGVANAVMMVTLVKPFVRLMVARWRKRAQESRATTIGIPVQELFEAALLEELAPPIAELQAVTEELVEEEAGRIAMRTVVIASAAIAATVGIAVAVATVIRRRREARAREAATEGSERVAIPIVTETVEAAEAMEEALVE